MTNKVFTTGSIGRGAIWSLVNNAGHQILSLLVFLITARFVSQEAFGVMAIGIVIVDAFRQIVISSFGTALLSKKDPDQKDYNAGFVLMVACSTLSALLVFASAGLIAAFLDFEEIEPVLKMISLMILVSGLSKTHEVWLSKNMQFKAIGIRNAISLCLGGVTGIYMAVNGHGLSSLVAQQMITSIASLILLWTTTRWRPSLDTGWTNIAEILSFSRHLVFSSTIRYANQHTDIAFCSYYMSAGVTGVYNAAKRIIMALDSVLTQALSAVALPMFSGLDNDRRVSAFHKATSLTSFLTAPLCAGVFVLSQDAIMILVGVSWLSAAPILSALIPAAYLATIGQYHQNIFLAYRKPQWQSALMFVYAASNVVLFFLVARYGAVAIAAAFSVRAFLLYPVSTLMALRLLNTPVLHYLRQIAPSVISAVLMAICVYLLRQNMEAMNVFLRVSILVPAGAAIYMALVLLLDHKMVVELQNVLSHILKKN